MRSTNLRALWRLTRTFRSSISVPCRERIVFRFLCAGLGMLAAAGAVQSQEPLSGNYYAHDPSTLIHDENNYYFFRTDRVLDACCGLARSGKRPGTTGAGCDVSQR